MRLLDPGSIFHPLYLASALAVMAGWLVSRGWAPRRALAVVFARETWLARATLIDLAFCLFYLLVLRTVVGRVENAAFVGALERTGGVLRALGIGARWAAPGLVEALMATFATMLAIDFASYWTHRGLHRGLLWRVHRVHHSAERLTPLTTYRQHPLEPLILYGARGLASGLALAALHAAFPRGTPVITVRGMGAGFFVYMFTVNLHHAPVPVRYPRWLRAVLVSPHIHHIHHSADARHHGANFGVVFSLWDRAFGTYLDEEVEVGELRFGV